MLILYINITMIKKMIFFYIIFFILLFSIYLFINKNKMLKIKFILLKIK